MSAPPVNYLDGMALGLNSTGLLQVSVNDISPKLWWTVTPNGPTDGGDFGPNTPGTETSGIQEMIKAMSATTGLRGYIKDATYPISTPIVPKFGIHITGESWSGTVLQAAQNNMSIISVGGNLTTSTCWENLGFDTGGFTGCTAIDYNMTEGDTLNMFHRIRTSGTFTTALDATGCENTDVNFFLTNGAGDIYLVTPNGNATGKFIVMNNAAQSVVYAVGQMVSLEDCTLNSIIFDKNATTAGTTFEMQLLRCYLANATNAAGQHKIRTGVGSAIRSLSIDSSYFGLKNSNAVFANTSASASGSISRLAVNNTEFDNLDASAVMWVSNASSGTFQIGGPNAFLNIPGQDSFHWQASEVSGTIISGTVMNNGFTTYGFTPRPVMFGVVTPTVPLSGTLQPNWFPYPVKAIIKTIGTVTSYLHADANGVTATIASALTPGQEIHLSPLDKIGIVYTTGPTWEWYGL